MFAVCVEPSPDTLRTLLNQMNLFIWIGVPLKFELIELGVGVQAVPVPSSNIGAIAVPAHT